MRKIKGFTLIELMIVVAIIAIIAAIAIPNLMQSRIRANEAASISVIKQIAAAQVQFQVARQGRLTDNSLAGRLGYADNYRNLFYGTSAGGGTVALALVSQAIADAATGNVPLAGAAGTSALTKLNSGNTGPYQGYHFQEPNGAAAAHFATTFAIVALPNNSTRTGTNSYYLGEDGTVYMKGVAPGLDGTSTTDIPSLIGTTSLTDPSKTVDNLIADGYSNL